MTWDVTWRVTCFLTWISLIGLTLGDNRTSISSKTHTDCQEPFFPLGGHCLFIDHLITGHWEDMKKVCEILGGHLLSLQNANLLNAISYHLLYNGLDTVSYWTGATDLPSEGSWVWSHDLSPVRQGSPLWGDLAYPSGELQPSGGAAENCGVLFRMDDFFLHDDDCRNSFSLICEQAEFEADDVDDDDEAAAAATAEDDAEEETPEDGCVLPFVSIGGRCLWVETLGTGSWSERKRLCESLGSTMLRLNDANVLGDIYDYLVTMGITDVSLWVGASDNDTEGEWKWLNGDLVSLHTPFWGNFALGTQEPSGGSSQNCAALNDKEHFLMHDYDCEAGSPNGVVCEM